MNEQQYENNRLSPEEVKIFLRDFFLTAGRKMPALLALLLVAVSIFCLWAWRSYSPDYQATATFTVYVSNALQSEVRAYNTSTAEQMAKTFPHILTSSALMDIVRRELNLSTLPSITASVLNNTNIFTLKVSSGDAQLSSDVLRVVMEYYPEISEFVVGPTVMKLLDESGVPTNPVNPLSFRTPVKRGLAVGLVLWIAWCGLLTLMRSTIHSEEELNSLLNVRCLGVIPKVRGRGTVAPCPRQGKSSELTGFSEAIRLTRIRTEKELKERQIQSLVVCSAVSGEGKTTVALNLASSLAEKGNCTLLIDCDLRNPSVAAYLGKENEAGITELLAGSAQAREVVRDSDQKNLYVIYAGGPSAQAAELLSQQNMKEFIDVCRKNFDYIILDTSPVLLLSDVAEMANCADGALLTIRENYAAKREVRESAQILAECRLPIVGCVLNHASTGILGSYGERYGYGKYYGHSEKN